MLINPVREDKTQRDAILAANDESYAGSQTSLIYQIDAEFQQKVTQLIQIDQSQSRARKFTGVTDTAFRNS